MDVNDLYWLAPYVELNGKGQLWGMLLLDGTEAWGGLASSQEACHCKRCVGVGLLPAVVSDGATWCRQRY